MIIINLLYNRPKNRILEKLNFELFFLFLSPLVDINNECMHCIGRFRILNLKLELNQYIALIACGVNGVFEIFSIGFCASKDFHATLIFFLKKWIIYVSPQKSEPPSWKFYYSWDPVSVSWSPPTFYNNSQFPSNTVEFWFNNFIKSFYNFFFTKRKYLGQKIFEIKNNCSSIIFLLRLIDCTDFGKNA